MRGSAAAARTTAYGRRLAAVGGSHAAAIFRQSAPRSLCRTLRHFSSRCTTAALVCPPARNLSALQQRRVGRSECQRDLALALGTFVAGVKRLVNGSLMWMPSICTAMMSSPDRSAPIHSFMRVADNWRRVYRTNFGSAARTTVNGSKLLSARCVVLHAKRHSAMSCGFPGGRCSQSSPICGIYS
jgi:hypothetical protein